MYDFSIEILVAGHYKNYKLIPAFLRRHESNILGILGLLFWGRNFYVVRNFVEYYDSQRLKVKKRQIKSQISFLNTFQITHRNSLKLIEVAQCN